VLEGRHEETVRHEARCALEIERRRQLLRVGDNVMFGVWVSPVQLVDLDRQEVVFACAALAVCALPDCGQCLCDRVCNTTQRLFMLVFAHRGCM
jgi:predicted metal-dependent HD superfamily phosphohydrolase